MSLADVIIGFTLATAKRTSLLHLSIQTSLKNIKSSTSMPWVKILLKLKLAHLIVSNPSALNTMKEAKERMPH
jgi:hypothetical protein